MFCKVPGVSGVNHQGRSSFTPPNVSVSEARKRYDWGTHCHTHWGTVPRWLADDIAKSFGPALYLHVAQYEMCR